MQTPAEPKVLRLDPDLVTVTPDWFKVKTESKLSESRLPRSNRPKPLHKESNYAPPSQILRDRKVVAIARLIGLDGQPLHDAEVEWTIDRGGVGVITGAGTA